MRVAPVVLWTGGQHVGDELALAGPRRPPQVTSTERLDQHLRSVQPRGMSWRQTRSPPTPAALRVVGRRTGDVTGPAVMDQEHALQPPVPPSELPQRSDVMRCGI